MIVHALMTLHLDYCNSLLFGIPKYQTDDLQKVHNAAAQLIFGIPKFHLHWLPVADCVQFKLLLLVYKAVKNQAPQYIQKLLLPHSISAYRLHSCDCDFSLCPLNYSQDLW